MMQRFNYRMITVAAATIYTFLWLSWQRGEDGSWMASSKPPVVEVNSLDDIQNATLGVSEARNPLLYRKAMKPRPADSCLSLLFSSRKSLL